MPRRRVGILLLRFAFLLTPVLAAPQKGSKDATPAGQPALFAASVNDRPLELHEFEQGSFGLFELGTPAEVEIRPDFDVRWVDLRPRSAGITPVIGTDHRSIRFQLKNPSPVTVEFNDDLKFVVHLFAYAPEKAAQRPGAANVRYFRPGKHEAGLIELKDGETLYLAPGAWVRGNVQSIGAKNVTIRGRGVLDGSNMFRRPERDRETPGSRNMVYLERTQNARIEGIAIFNSMTWTVFVRNTTGTRIDGVNILNPSDNYGDDGFDIVSSSDVVVENTFVRTNDDCVVIKNLDDVEVHDIVVRHSVFWNMPTGGNGIETGFELRSHRVHDIRFEDIDLIHVERESAISIHHGDAAVVENISFDNIRVEDVRRKLIDFAVVYAQYGADRPADDLENRRRLDRGGAWDGILSYAPDEKAERSNFRGHIKNVRVTNLQVLEGALPYSVIAGFDNGHAVEDVVIEGLEYQARPIRNAEDCKVTTQYARGVTFR